MYLITWMAATLYLGDSSTGYIGIVHAVSLAWLLNREEPSVVLLVLLVRLFLGQDGVV